MARKYSCIPTFGESPSSVGSCEMNFLLRCRCGEGSIALLMMSIIESVDFDWFNGSACLI